MLHSTLLRSTFTRFLFLTVTSVTSVHFVQAQGCGSNGNLTIEPDGSNTPEIVRVIDTVISGTYDDDLGEVGVGSVEIGSPDGTITQTQTLRITNTGALYPDNTSTCFTSGNTATVAIFKTGILDMQGGTVEAPNITVTGPVAGDAATGGKLSGYGTLSTFFDDTANEGAVFSMNRATIAPSGGILSLSNPGNFINIANSSYIVSLGSEHYLSIAGDLTLTNTRLILNVPAGFTAAPGQVFTLVKFTNSTINGNFLDSNGAVLSEGDTVTVNGIDLKITYQGGADGVDILLYREGSSNTPPTISAIANQTTNEDTAKGPLAFTIGDAQTPDALTVTVASSNLTLLPLNRITLGGSGANRTITLNPALNKSGSATVTLTVTDGELSDSSQFILAVTPVNDAPVAQSQTLTTNANTPLNITLPASDIENNALTYSIVTAPTHGTLSGTGANRTYTPTANYSGTDSFTFRANDGSANSNTATINLTVRSTLSINDVSITEGNSGAQAATFTVTLAGISSQNITVNYATANGTSNPATAGSDYVATSGTLTFAAGQTSKTITVMVNGDTTIEANETFFVNLSSASAAVITDSQGMGTIIDNDSGSRLNINDVTVQEGNSGTVSATFTVTLTSASAQTVTVTATTVNGTAKAPGDYTARNTSFSFAPGQTSRTLSVSVQGDLLDEANEVFYVLLSSPTNAAINRGRGVCTITDNDATPTLSIDDIIVKEYNSGQTTAALRLKLSAPSGQAVKVSYATANSTATGGSDYGAVAPTVVAFNSGSLYAYARVLINGDLLPEANETFLVNLSSPQNAILTDNQAIGTILNDDSPPALTINNVSIAEGNSGTKNLTFTVALSKASGQTVTVKYATADGIARSTSDYVAKSGTLSFAPGTALTRTISITINGDTLFEGNETLFVLLSGAVNASIGTARGTGTITNDDSSD
jgi:hypothetical protein